MDLGFPDRRTVSVWEESLKTNLRNVRSKGHQCIELRRREGCLLFFCIICNKHLSFSSYLSAHLDGELHAKTLATAQVTLLKSNPWPFDDGVSLFHSDLEEQSKNKFLYTHHTDAGSHALLGRTGQLLVIPGVLRNDEVSSLAVKYIGVGKIGTRFYEKDGVSSEVLRIWCEWLGNVGSTSKDINGIPAHEFAIVTFSYNDNLGRQGFFYGFRHLLPSSPYSESVDTGCSNDEETKALSDIEDTDHGDFLKGDGKPKSSIRRFFANDDQLVHSRYLSSKLMQQLLIDQDRDRKCFLCLQVMLPNKDVAALMNRETGKLVCSSTNSTGAFHVFHTGCLIQWILHREMEAFKKLSVEKPRYRKKVKGNNEPKQETQDKQICSAFCGQCGGTGKTVDEDDLEKQTFFKDEMTRYFLKLSSTREAWIQNPEILLDNCSMGLCFPLKFVETYKENVSPLKLLHFYRAND